jgi:molybdopterin molybdotransferase
MGTDKAELEVGGRRLLDIAVEALAGAGADPVLVVGDPPGGGRRTVAGATVVADVHPGEGPLGGLVTALRAAVERTSADDVDLVVVVVACDMPGFDAPTARGLADALAAAPSAAAAAAVVDGRPQPLTAAWRPSLALAVLADAYAAGERAPRRVLPRLDVVAVDGLDPRALHDVDRPDDLHRYADPATPGGEPARRPPDTTEPT